MPKIQIILPLPSLGIIATSVKCLLTKINSLIKDSGYVIVLFATARTEPGLLYPNRATLAYDRYRTIRNTRGLLSEAR